MTGTSLVQSVFSLQQPAMVAAGPRRIVPAHRRVAGGSLSPLILFLVACLSAGGCSTLLSGASQGFANNLSSAILDSDDVELVRDGAPAYLLLIDGLLEGSPDDAGLLVTAARLNSAYAGAFVEERVRAQRMHAKALIMAQRAVCEEIKGGCGLDTLALPAFTAWLAARRAADAPLLYALGSAWAGWMQVHSDDFNAIAQLARVKALMTRVVELDEKLDHGGAHLYLGVFETLFPPAMGGRPDVGRMHFEKAIELSGGRHLLTRVMYAENYARLVFDRDLHDRLLSDVLAADPKAKGLTLINIVAQARAHKLMETADDYF